MYSIYPSAYFGPNNIYKARTYYCKRFHHGMTYKIVCSKWDEFFYIAFETYKRIKHVTF